MKTKKAKIENPQAFPLKEALNNDELGMTLRDYFAAKAMIGLIDQTNPNANPRLSLKGVADISYSVANEMLIRRLKP